VSVAQRDGHGLGVEFGTLRAGVGVVDGEEQGGLLRALGFEPVGLDGGHVHKGNVLGGGQLAKFGVVAHVALDMRLAVGTVLPDIPDGEGEQDRRSLFGPDIGDVFAHIPAVRVDRFAMAVGEGNVPGFFAESLEGAAGLGPVEAAAIVVPHLQKNIIAWLDLGEHMVPGAFVDEGAAAAAGASAVGDVDPGGVEVVGEVVSPAEVGLIAGGGVADDEDSGESRIERNGLRSGGLGRRNGRLGRSLGEDGGGGEQQNGGVAISRELERLDLEHGGKTVGRHPKFQ